MGERHTDVGRLGPLTYLLYQKQGRINHLVDIKVVDIKVMMREANYFAKVTIEASEISYVFMFFYALVKSLNSWSGASSFCLTES